MSVFDKKEIGNLGGNEKRLSSSKWSTDNSIIDDFCRKCGVSRQDSIFLLAELVDSIRTAIMENGVVTVRKLGTFSLRTRKKTKIRSVSTGETITIPLMYRIAFRPASSFKALANQKIKRNLIGIYNIKEGKENV
jgi:nucleoid DNA-binding protein